MFKEITLSTPWLKAVAPYMAKNCEKEINVSLLYFLFCSGFIISKGEFWPHRFTFFRNLCCAVKSLKIPALS